MAEPRQYLLAGFADTTPMLAAAKRMRETTRGEVETYTPYPVHGIDAALGLRKSVMPKLIGTGALLGVCGGYTLQYWMMNIAYPLNIGGRPMHSMPAFIPVTFECGVLLAALTAFFGVLAICGMPRPYHPVFDAESFRRASIDRFFVSVEVFGGDERKAIEAELTELGAEQVDFVQERWS